MKKSTVVSLNKVKIFDIIYKNRVILILSLLFAVGVILGVITYAKSDMAQSLSKGFFESYITKRTMGSFISVFFSSFAFSLLITIFAFLIGGSIMGVIISPLYICTFGLSYGIVASFLYNTYSIKGIAFCSVIFIPSTIIVLIGLVFAGRHSVNFSLTIAKLTLTNSLARNLYEDFKKYCSNYIVVTVFILLSALVDASFSKLFLKFFEF